MKQQRQVITDFQRVQRLQEIQNEETAEGEARDRAKKNLDFVQFQRAGMKDFVGLIRRSPAAAQALITLATFMNRTNTISIPMKTLSTACNASRATMSRAVKLLSGEGWLKVTQIGATRAYQVNSNAFWSAARDLKEFSDVFTAKITPSTSDSSTAEIGFILRAKPVPIVTFTKKKSINQPKREPKDD